MKNLLPIFGLLTVLLSACSNGKEKPDSSISNEDLQSITLGIMPTLESFPFYVAKKKGIYDSLGVNLDFICFNSANDRNAAFVTEQIDGMIIDYPSAVQLQVHHPLALIMKNDGYFCFITGKGSALNQLNQLEEKNVAVSRGTIIEYATDVVCHKAGISSYRNNRPEISQIPLRLSMLQYGQIDATFLPDPYATIAMKDGNRSLISTCELDIYMTGTAFSDKAIREKRREITLLIKGYNLGVSYIQSHPQSKLNSLLTEATGIPETLAGLIILPSYTMATRPDSSNISKAQEWLKEKGYLPHYRQNTNLVDTTFITSTNNKS